MAVASWLLGGRSLRTRRNHNSRHENDEDYVQLDSNKDASESMYEILSGLTQCDGVSEGKRLSYLVNFVKLVNKADVNYDDFGYSAEEILYCLRPLAFHHSAQLKNASFRAVRHFIKTEHHVDLYIKLKFDFLVARQITAAGIQLCRRVLCVCPAKFTSAPVQAMVALTHPNHSDILQATALAFLSELAVLNPEVFVSCGGVNAILRNLPYLKPKMTEALIAPLLYLINKPQTREKAGINLDCLTDPVFMDRTLSHKCGEGVRVSTTALVCLLRSWPGLLHLGQGSSAAILSIVNTLYIPHLQRVMLSAMYEVFGLTAPDWTDDMSVALDGVDPHRWQQNYSLSDGFVAAEALALYPHLAAARLNLVEVHLSLVLRSLLEANLLDAIVHVIVSDDTFKSVYATILLGELLGLVDKWLPVEVTKLLPGLPNLISYSIRGRPITPATSTHPPSVSMTSSSLYHHSLVLEECMWEASCKEGLGDSKMFEVSNESSCFRSLDNGSEKRCRAHCAVRALAKLSQLRRTTPTPSLFLSQLLQTLLVEQTDQVTHIVPTLSGCIEECIKESGVMSMKDPLSWNWDTIQAVLKMGTDGLPKSGENNKKSFIRRLVNFYLPGIGRFSKIPSSCDRKSTSKLTLAALDLISLLLASPLDSDWGGMALELVSGIKSCIVEILSSKSAYDCFLSPHACMNTHSRDYFLMLGRYSRTPEGRLVLDKIQIYPSLTDLISTTNHDCYIKLILSALDYSHDENARKLLSKAVEAKSESGRMYVTRLLHSFLRIGLTAGRLRDFVFYLLVLQLEDKKRSVADYAISVLHEACDNREYVDCLVSQCPGLVRLGDQGHLLMVRLLSSPHGFKQMQQSNFVYNELDKWASHFNYRYVGLVEGLLLEGMTQSSLSSAASRWQECSGRCSQARELFLPPHLYQQLSSHVAGRRLLLSHPSIPSLAQSVLEGKWSNDTDIVRLKAALYALSGIVVYLHDTVASQSALNQLDPSPSPAPAHNSPDRSRLEGWSDEMSPASDDSRVDYSALIAAMIELATRCPVYSVRGVAYIALNNISTSARGATLLRSHGWECVRHDRHQKWPLLMTSLHYTDELLHANADCTSDTSSEVNKSSSLMEDTMLEDDCSSEFFWGIPGCKTQKVRERRCATLPPPHPLGHLHPSTHSRSYSESKADSIPDSATDYKSRSGRKMRSNSYTDSGTCGDCSYKFRHHSFSERHSKLSPIQSMSSFTSVSHPSSTRLRFNFLRSQSAALTGKLKRSNESVLKSLAQPSPYPEGLITYADLLRVDSTTSSHTRDEEGGQEEADFSLMDPPGSEESTADPVDQTSFSHSADTDGGCEGEDDRQPRYLGICMPDRLSCLFPRQDRLSVNSHVAFVAKVLHSQCLDDLKNPYFHREICFLGSRGVHNTMVSTSESECGGGYLISGSDLALDKESLQDNDSDSDTANDLAYMVEHPMILKSPVIIRSEILRMVEQLSNPLLHKTCKQSLLQIKQAHGEVFKEICVLSDVCHILSVCHIHVMSRELIHNLFDSGYDTMMHDANAYLQEVNERRGMNQLYGSHPSLNSNYH